MGQPENDGHLCPGDYSLGLFEEAACTCKGSCPFGRSFFLQVLNKAEVFTRANFPARAWFSLFPV